MNRSAYIKIASIAGLVTLLCVGLFVWKQRGLKKSIPATPASIVEIVASTTPSIPLLTYIEVTGGCGAHFEGDCLNVHSRPATTSPIVARLRNGIVLRFASTSTDSAGHLWYQIAFDLVRYPERVSGSWFVRSDFVKPFQNVGSVEIPYHKNVDTGQHIVITLSEQMLYAYDGDVLFMKTPISAGFELTPTPLGTFTIYSKNPSRYMQGPQPGIENYYDLPGVPWDMYFTEYGAAIHGAYWHTDFGSEQSHGCVNVAPDQARKLYEWTKLGTKVTIQN